MHIGASGMRLAPVMCNKTVAPSCACSGLRRGLTLIEVLIAATVFSIAMLFGLSVFVYALQGLNRARQMAFCLREVKAAMQNVAVSSNPVNASQLVVDPRTDRQYTIQTIITDATTGMAIASRNRLIWVTIVAGTTTHTVASYPAPVGTTPVILYELSEWRIVPGVPGDPGWPAVILVP